MVRLVKFTVACLNLCLDIDQLCPLDVDMWEYLMREALDPPSFYDRAFENLADSFLLRYYGINHTPENIEELYSHMIDYFSI